MENEKSPILEIKDLRVTYETDIEVVEAVNGISFQIEKGKTLGLVGETGAGKTTTALSILRLLPETTGRIKGGEICFEGEDLLHVDGANAGRERKPHLYGISRPDVFAESGLHSRRSNWRGNSTSQA